MEAKTKYDRWTQLSCWGEDGKENTGQSHVTKKWWTVPVPDGIWAHAFVSQSSWGSPE